MIKNFLNFEWKQFARSSYFQKGIAIKILLALAVLYFGGIALLVGTGLFFILKKTMPETDPIIIVNNYLVYWFLFDLALRFFMQQLPVMNVKPLMIVPVKRNTIINYLLGKTAISFFNFLPLFVFVPFSIVLLIQGYPVINVVCWFFAMLFLVLSNNFINFLINKSNTYFYVLISVFAIFIGLEFFNIYKVSVPIGVAFNTLYNNPILSIIPLILMIALYAINFNFIKKEFYLDDAVSKKIKEVNATDLSWMDRFGSVAIFLKNDVKLIYRNARPKQVMMMSFLFLFYGCE